MGDELGGKLGDALTCALARIGVLGAISDRDDIRIRTFLSKANRQAAGEILAWMADFGMHTAHAEDGSVRGVLAGSNPGAVPLLIGSHFDTVVNAGAYDGPLGIVTALAALEVLRAEGIELPFPVHVLGFSDEEGVRFQTTYLGSRSVVAQLDPATRAATDPDGHSVAYVLATEGWSNGATEIRYGQGEARGYVEVHIEQGRVLEEAGLPVCGVTSIVGQSRLAVSLTGLADHAGTTPMDMRRDALTGAAEAILAAEALGRATHDAVVTVGKLDVLPGSSNSIPQSAVFTVDLRHPNDATRLGLRDALEGELVRIAKVRGLDLNWRDVQEDDATPCDPTLSAAMVAAAESVTGSDLAIPSGAGHDGVSLARVMPIAMLFVRCRSGLSHHPDEYASPEDIGAGIETLTRFLKELPA